MATMAIGYVQGGPTKHTAKPYSIPSQWLTIHHSVGHVWEAYVLSYHSNKQWFNLRAGRKDQTVELGPMKTFRWKMKSYHAFKMPPFLIGTHMVPPKLCHKKLPIRPKNISLQLHHSGQSTFHFTISLTAFWVFSIVYMTSKWKTRATQNWLFPTILTWPYPAMVLTKSS